LRQTGGEIRAEAAAPIPDWRWLDEYLQTDVDLSAVLARFPQDDHLAAATTACRGLRLLRQDPWECLASFILSSNKQITQIRQMIDRLCRELGQRVTTPANAKVGQAFPRPEAVAAAPLALLAECRLGYRAPYLKATAARVASGEIDLSKLPGMALAEAREALVTLPGVGPKVADCVLLFSLGHRRAFPVDVWIERVLRELYFGCRSVAPARRRQFVEDYFGAEAGYAQQYLFHYARTVLTASQPDRRSKATARV
jgi:N-glycosylase/DNA lyase